MLQYCDSFCHPSVSISYTYMCLLLKDNFKLKSMNRELPDIQAGFRKGRGTRDQIANIHWIMEKAREVQKSIYFCFIDYAKAFDCVDHNKQENSERDAHIRPPDLPLEKFACRSGSNS